MRRKIEATLARLRAQPHDLPTFYSYLPVPRLYVAQVEMPLFQTVVAAGRTETELKRCIEAEVKAWEEDWIEY